MAVRIVVCAKQVIDPEMPASAFRVDIGARRVIPPPGIPPVVNGFDENAVEAALRIKDSVGATVTVISLGKTFAMDVMKKPLSMGADQLILLQDDAFDNLDPFNTARVLAAAIRKTGGFDIVLCGRQASDWDNAQVPLGLAEELGIPCITIAQKVNVGDGTITVERSLKDGYEVVEARLPALVTVTNELGQPRYPTLRGIMAASRKTPTIWKTADLGIDASTMKPKLQITDLFVPVKQAQCEVIKGDDEADAGRKLALKLREMKLI